MVSRLNRITDFNEFSHRDTLILEERNKQLFTGKTDIHAGRANNLKLI